MRDIPPVGEPVQGLEPELLAQINDLAEELLSTGGNLMGALFSKNGNQVSRRLGICRASCHLHFGCPPLPGGRGHRYLRVGSLIPR